MGSRRKAASLFDVDARAHDPDVGKLQFGRSDVPSSVGRGREKGRRQGG
jgi:hypothetical protein